MNLMKEHDISVFEMISQFHNFIDCFTVNLTAPLKGCARGICHNAAKPTVGRHFLLLFGAPIGEVKHLD